MMVTIMPSGFRRRLSFALCAAVLLFCCVSAQVRAASDQFLLVRRSLETQFVRLQAISQDQLAFLDERAAATQLPIAECVALLNPNIAMQQRTRGLLILADGQRLPGEAMLRAQPQDGTLAWMHPWLGRIDVPVDLIESVLLNAVAVAPPPSDADVIEFNNGDRQVGFITQLGNPIMLEVDRGGQQEMVEVPLNLVAAITLVTPRTSPTGRRVWFAEGTVLDVQSIQVQRDGYVRLVGPSFLPDSQPIQVMLSQIAAVLLDSSALVPLASLSPSRVEGPPTRYVVPKPQAIDSASGSAPLGLSQVEFRGPLTVYYALPAGCTRFAAEAEMPPAALQWGDVELIIKTGDHEHMRVRLNRNFPAARINVPVTGRELIIELAPAAHGPIHDHVILRRAMLLVER